MSTSQTPSSEHHLSHTWLFKIFKDLLKSILKHDPTCNVNHLGRKITKDKEIMTKENSPKGREHHAEEKFTKRKYFTE